jgi:hypothetical protein
VTTLLFNAESRVWHLLRTRRSPSVNASLLRRDQPQRSAKALRNNLTF